MVYLLKNLRVYSPKDLGLCDILISNGVIYKIAQTGKIATPDWVEVTDCSNFIAFPGIIDAHVHIIGGGCEDGFNSRVIDIDSRDLFYAGVTTVVGVLGADNQTKSLKSLYAKAKSLEDEGLTTYIYTGSYTLPLVTLTEDATTDMVLIDKVIGVGEVAISDHRSSHPNVDDLLNISTKAYLGSLLSGKAGVVHLHLGDGKSRLESLNKVIEISDLPVDIFVPTHVNRNQHLFHDAIRYAKTTGNIDMTSGERVGIDIPAAIETLLREGVDMTRVTISSDANGTAPGGAICTAYSLYRDTVRAILEKQISPEIAFKLVTENVAKRLKLYPRKGVIAKGSDADLLIVDGDYKLKKLIARGKFIINNN